ncbi:MAG: rRNA processing protein RimM [Acidobacteriaceae bacterium]
MKLFALPKDVSGREFPVRELEIEQLWPHKELLVLKFRGVDSISSAETLVGCELQVPGSDRAPLDRGWTYISDLAGCTVYDGGQEIGRVKDVQFGAGEAPLLIVQKGTKEYEIPFAEQFLQKIDTERKRIDMRLPEGLLEVNAPLTTEEKQQQVELQKQASTREPRAGGPITGKSGKRR